MADSQMLGRGARVLLVVASLVIVIAGLRAASTLLLPFLLAAFLAILSMPLLAGLRRLRLPLPLAVLGTVLGICVALAVMLSVVGGSVNGFVAKSEEYQVKLNDLRDQLIAELEAYDIDLSDWLAEEKISPSAIFSYLRTAIASATLVLSNFALVLLTLVFILFEASVLPKKLHAALGASGTDDLPLEKIAGDVQLYFGIKTAISLVTGVVIGAWVWACGVDFFLLWGFLAFLLNFIPNIGSIMAAVPAVLLALVQHDPARAFLVALGYVAVSMLMGNLVEPRLMGRRFGLSTLVVFLSLCFWGWVWGPIGMLLSVPLTMFVKILLENSEDLRWVAMLLSSERDERSQA